MCLLAAWRWRQDEEVMEAVKTGQADDLDGTLASLGSKAEALKGVARVGIA